MKMVVKCESFDRVEKAASFGVQSIIVVSPLYHTHHSLNFVKRRKPSRGSKKVEIRNFFFIFYPKIHVLRAFKNDYPEISRN